MKNAAHIAQQAEFDASIAEKRGADCNPEYFPNMALEDTPHCFGSV